MIRDVVRALIFVIGFLLIVAEIQQFDEANVPEGSKHEAKVP